MAMSRQLLQKSCIRAKDKEWMTSENQKKVYIAYRAIFNGENARIRKYSTIFNIVKQHGKSTGPILVEGIDPKRIVRILKELLARNLFESEGEARMAFPDLFTTTMAQDAQHSLLEADAAKSEAEVLKDIALLDNDQDEDHTEESHDEVALILPTATPSEFHIDGVQVPSLYPLYIPFKAQYQILSRTQRLLEECCYAFTEQWLPDLLEERQWDCPEAIELNTWTIVVVKRLKKLPAHCFGYLGSKPSMSLREVLISINDLRHAAVHRIRTSAKGISEMIRSATRFARALGGLVWEKQLKELQRELDGRIRAMELHKDLLETKHTKELQDIARQRKELDELEKNSLTSMLKEDKEYCSSIGHLLSRSARRILAGATYDGLNLTEAEQDLAFETANEKELPPSVDHELPQQAVLDPIKTKPTAFRDCSPDRHVFRLDSERLQDSKLGSLASSNTQGRTHHGTESTELRTQDAIEENIAFPPEARSASPRPRDLEHCLGQDAYATLSEAVDGKIDTYGFNSKFRKLSSKRMKKIYGVIRKRTKLNISAYQPELDDFIRARFATFRDEKREQVNVVPTTKENPASLSIGEGLLSSNNKSEEYEPGRFIVTSHTPPHTPDETSDAFSPLSGPRSSYSPPFEPVSLRLRSKKPRLKYFKDFKVMDWSDIDSAIGASTLRTENL